MADKIDLQLNRGAVYILQQVLSQPWTNSPKQLYISGKLAYELDESYDDKPPAKAEEFEAWARAGVILKVTDIEKDVTKAAYVNAITEGKLAPNKLHLIIFDALGFPEPDSASLAKCTLPLGSCLLLSKLLILPSWAKTRDVFQSASFLSASLEKTVMGLESRENDFNAWAKEEVTVTWDKSVCKTCLEAAIKNKQVVPTRYFLSLAEALDMTNID